MDATELKASINKDISTLDVKVLEVISRHVKRIIVSMQKEEAMKPYKIKISDRIAKMSGRFQYPKGKDYKELRDEFLNDKYNML